ncbi:MAG: HEAT repeat domain-containing protein [Fibrobacteria bacterium]|nr:HEAT repeat domain-containing protein [Fibrobacteria bacterium]
MDEQEIATKLQSQNLVDIKVVLGYLEKKGNLPHLKPILGKLVHLDDADIKAAGIKAAASIIKRALTQKFGEISCQSRKKLVSVLKTLDPTLVDTLLAQLESSEHSARMNAIKILGLIENDVKIKKMVNQVEKFKDDKVRATAVSMMQYNFNNVDIEQIFRFLNDSDNRVVANCIEVIENLISEKFLTVLRDHATHANNRVRANAIKALWGLGYDKIELYEFLKEMMTNEESFLMRASALWAVGECCEESDKKFIGFIEQGLQDKEKLVRENAIKAAINIGHRVEKKYKDAMHPEEYDAMKRFLDKIN